MNIKYPRTEIMAVLGSKVYPIYVTETSDEVELLLGEGNRDSLLSFEAAIKKNHNNGLWYPSCGADPYWTEWVIKKSAIKSFVKLPAPKVKIDYYPETEDF